MIKNENGSISGDDKIGRISVPSRGVEGSYAAGAEFIEITIHKKPMYIPEIVVKQFIREFFVR